MTDKEINDFIKQRKEDVLAYEGIDNFESMYKQYVAYLKSWDFSKNYLPDDFEDYFFDELFIV